jgi:enoyl-CoA hydratase/carnithine racemase
MDMILTGRTVEANEGLALGFVNSVVPHAQLMSEARRWANLILQCSPFSIRASKALVNQSLEDASVQAAFELQGANPALAALLKSHDAVEGPRAFAEKRKPRWS